MPLIETAMRRPLAKVAMVAVAVAALTGLASAPASAAVTVSCFTSIPTDRFCTFTNGSRSVTVSINLNEIRTQVSGSAWHNSGTFVSAVVYVKQCDGYGHNCSTIAANDKLNPSRDFVSTSLKPTFRGHTYIACASWTDGVGWHEGGTDTQRSVRRSRSTISSSTVLTHRVRPGSMTAE
jgi:hypothetical protein